MSPTGCARFVASGANIFLQKLALSPTYVDAILGIVALTILTSVIRIYVCITYVFILISFPLNTQWLICWCTIVSPAKALYICSSFVIYCSIESKYPLRTSQLCIICSWSYFFIIQGPQLHQVWCR